MLNGGHSNSVFFLSLCLNPPFKIISMLIVSKIRFIKEFESEAAHLFQIFKINEGCADKFCTFLSIFDYNFYQEL